MSLNQSIVEDAAVSLRSQRVKSEIGRVKSGKAFPISLFTLHSSFPHLAPGEREGERDSFGEVVQVRFARTLTRPLPRGEEKREAIRRLDPAIPEEAAATDKESLSVQTTSKGA